MKLLIDECVLGETAMLLRNAGFDLVTIQELGKEAIDDVHKVLMRLLKELKPTEIKKSLIIVDRNKYRLRRE